MVSGARYWVIDWELNSIIYTDNILDENEGWSCRYKDDGELMKDFIKELKHIKEWGRGEE